MAKKFLPVRMDQEEKEKFAAICKRRGISASKGMREAMRLYGGFTDEFLEMLEEIQERFNLQPHQVLENMIWELSARENAAAKLGFQDRNQLGIFPRFHSGELLTGRKFYQQRYHEWLRCYRARLPKTEEEEAAFKAEGERIERELGYRQ